MQGTAVSRGRRCQGERVFIGDAPRRRRPAFTLVELLTVIGIIVILVAILLPVLRGARAQSESIQCMNNLHSIGQAVQVFTASHDGYFAPARNYSEWEYPGTTRQIDPNDDNAYWGVFYAVAANLKRETFSCPAISQKERTTGTNSPAGYANMWCTYGLNGWGNNHVSW